MQLWSFRPSRPLKQDSPLKLGYLYLSTGCEACALHLRSEKSTSRRASLIACGLVSNSHLCKKTPDRSSVLWVDDTWTDTSTCSIFNRDQTSTLACRFAKQKGGTVESCVEQHLMAMQRAVLCWLLPSVILKASALCDNQLLWLKPDSCCYHAMIVSCLHMCGPMGSAHLAIRGWQPF